MSNNFQEDEIVFNFPKSIKLEKLDEKGSKIPIGMSLVDLLIEEEDRFLLIEIKDPFCSKTPIKIKDSFVKENIKGDQFISDKLVPKIRDSYSFLHLMDRVNSKKLIYIVFLDNNQYNIDPPLLVNFKDRLVAKIKHEGQEPWKRDYLDNCIILSIEKWNKHFSDKNWSVQRITQQQNTSGATTTP